jgi:hypoxanthine phosphoribosyltransferase
MKSTQIKIEDLTFDPLLDAIFIEEKVEELARLIELDYRDKKEPVIFVGIMNGAVFFMVDLLRKLKMKYRFDFLKASSYKGQKSTGKVNLSGLLKEKLEGAHIIIVEDIVDTGITLSYLRKWFAEQKTKSVRIASIFFKPDAYQLEEKPDYFGFEIPNDFVVGYGLDYNGLGRDLKDLYILAK